MVPAFRRPLPVAVGQSDARGSLPVTVTDAVRLRRGRGLRGTDRGTTAGGGPQQSAVRSVPTFPFREVARRPGPADPATDLGDRGDPGALWLHHLIEAGQLGMCLAAGHHHRSVVRSTPERLDRYPVQPHGLLRHVDTPCGAEPGIDIRLCLQFRWFPPSGSEGLNRLTLGFVSAGGGPAEFVEWARKGDS